MNACTDPLAREGKTSAPFTPVGGIAQSGVYAYSRNPMYVASCVVIAPGVAALTGKTLLAPRYFPLSLQGNVLLNPKP